MEKWAKAVNFTIMGGDDVVDLRCTTSYLDNSTKELLI